MKKLGVLAAGSLLLAAFPQAALSKASVLKIQPEGSQLAAMDSGAQVVTSQMAGSTVVMRAPEPFEGKRTRIFFTFVNNSQYPVNVGPENVTSTQVAVISYDQLIAEQKRSEGVDKFFAAIGAVGKALSATDAGNQSTSTSYSGYVDCGIGCGGAYNGSAVSRTYSPYAARQAQAQAAAENAAAASEMHSGHASERNAIARNLQTTTVNPGHYITGMLTFEVPTAVRRGKKAVPISLAIRMGSDVHMLRGFAGPLGAPPPVISSITTSQITPPLASNTVSPTVLANNQAQILNAGDLVNGSDYPSGSLSRGEEGIAAFKLTLKNGRPASCKIISSSGFEELDEATCRLATERSVFDMSRLPKGDWSTYSNRVRWILSASAPRANSVNLSASQSVSRIDPNKIRCQYSDGVVSFVNAGNPCITPAAALSQPLVSNIVPPTAPANIVDQGFAQALYTLGVSYATGQGVAQNDATAVNYFRQAADKGYAQAQNYLGTMYENGKGITRDDATAVSFYRKAADQGFAYAQNNLGQMYAIGKGVAQNDPVAVNLFHKAAAQGVALAQHNLGVMYLNGRGVTQDDATAADWFRKAADQGYAGAQHNLGVLFQSGKGVTQNYPAAADWYRKAADQGFAYAQNNLGSMYESGLGVAKNDATAADWYRRAADQGFANAQNNLGAMYTHGRGVAQDYAVAVNYFRKAADQGDIGGYRNLGAMYTNGHGVSKDYATAVNFYRKAADQGDTEAEYILGFIYTSGRGVTQDDATAADWFRKAADKGHAKARKKLDAMSASGRESVLGSQSK